MSNPNFTKSKNNLFTGSDTVFQVQLTYNGEPCDSVAFTVLYNDSFNRGKVQKIAIPADQCIYTAPQWEVRFPATQQHGYGFYSLSCLITTDTGLKRSLTFRDCFYLDDTNNPVSPYEPIILGPSNVKVDDLLSGVIVTPFNMFIRYDEPQSLDDDKKDQACKNIGAARDIKIEDGSSLIDRETGIATIPKAKDGVFGVIKDAPSDAKQYARKNGAWVEVSGGAGTVTDVKIGTTSIVDTSGVATIPNAEYGKKGVIDDAPLGGDSYARKDGAWVKTLSPTVDTSMSDTSTNAVQNKTIKGYVDSAINTEVTARNTAISTAITTEVTDRNAAIDAAIQALDAPDTGIAGQAVRSVSETDGVITVTRSATIDEVKVNGTALTPTEGSVDIPVGIAADAPSDNKSYARKDGAWTEVVGAVIDTSMSGTSTNAVQNKVIKTYVDDAITTEVTDRNTAISTAIQALDKGDSPVTGQAVRSVSEADGIISVTRSQTVDAVQIDATPLSNTNGTVTIPNASNSQKGVIKDAPSDTKSYARKDGEWVEITGGGTITIDTTMSDTSTNAVQNKVIKTYVDRWGVKNANGDPLEKDMYGKVQIPWASYDAEHNKYIPGVFSVPDVSPYPVVPGLICYDEDGNHTLAIQLAGPDQPGVIEDIPEGNATDREVLYVRRFYDPGDGTDPVREWKEFNQIKGLKGPVNTPQHFYYPDSTTGLITLPIASRTEYGLVKVRLTGTTEVPTAQFDVDAIGLGSADQLRIRIATPTNRGVIKEVPAATTEDVLYVRKRKADTTVEWAVLPASISDAQIDGTSIVTSGIANIPTASASAKGIVKVGSNISVETDGTISVPAATSSSLGVVKPGTNTSIDANGALSVPNATDLIAGAIMEPSSSATNTTFARYRNSAGNLSWRPLQSSATTLPATSLVANCFYNLGSISSLAVPALPSGMQPFDDITIQFTASSAFTPTYTTTVKWLGGAAPTIVADHTYVICFRNGLGVWSEFF